jgi:threonine/homoserine/homoserine lactone efflux protein
MRVTLTIVAELLLPLLKAAGALLLLWIAVQLLVPEDESDGEGGGWCRAWRRRSRRSCWPTW